MTLKFYDSPFHVTHEDDVASKMAMKMDLSIMIKKLIESRKWTQSDAAKMLGIKQSRVSDLVNAKIEKFTVDSMLDMLDKLGFRASWRMPNMSEASITISRKAVASI